MESSREYIEYKSLKSLNKLKKNLKESDENDKVIRSYLKLYFLDLKPGQRNTKNIC